MAQIANTTSFVAVKVFAKEEFDLEDEVRISHKHEPYP